MIPTLQLMAIRNPEISPVGKRFNRQNNRFAAGYYAIEQIIR